MPVLAVTDAKGFRRRGAAVAKFLRPIARRAGGPSWSPTSVSTSALVIAAHDGSPPTSPYQDWRFATIADRFSAMYYERWLRTDATFWRLERAYLHLYQKNEAYDVEVLCLHCDPYEAATAPHAIYKRGPHFHVSAAGDPIKHSHFAVHGGYLATVLASIGSLTKTMEWAIQMVRDEVLEALR